MGRFHPKQTHRFKVLYANYTKNTNDRNLLLSIQSSLLPPLCRIIFEYARPLVTPGTYKREREVDKKDKKSFEKMTSNEKYLFCYSRSTLYVYSLDGKMTLVSRLVISMGVAEILCATANDTRLIIVHNDNEVKNISWIDLTEPCENWEIGRQRSTLRKDNARGFLLINLLCRCVLLENHLHIFPRNIFEVPYSCWSSLTFDTVTDFSNRSYGSFPYMKKITNWNNLDLLFTTEYYEFERKIMSHYIYEMMGHDNRIYVLHRLPEAEDQSSINIYDRTFIYKDRMVFKEDVKDFRIIDNHIIILMHDKMHVIPQLIDFITFLLKSCLIKLDY